MKRRQMTQFLALLAGGAALPALASAPVLCGSPAGESAAQNLSRDHFEAQLGQTFRIGGRSARTLRLRAIQSACCHHRAEQFHALFEAGPGAPLKEGIYVLQGRDRPLMELFMTVSDQGRSGQRLVATINLQTVA